MFEVGKCYCFSVPPGWILVGRVAELTETHVVLADSFHLETVAEGVSAIALGVHGAVDKSVTKSYPLPEGARLNLDGILIAVPCDVEIAKLSKAHLVAAVKGRK